MLINQDFTWDRSKFIGGSDIGAILGLSKFRTPLQVWQEKVGQEVPKQNSLPLRFGSFAEDFVAQEYAMATGNEVTTHIEPFIHPQYPFLSGHIDRFVLRANTSLFTSSGQLNTSTLLECKTASPFAKDEWGDPGSDEVPMSYLVQCAWYMLLTGCTRSDLAVLFSNSDFRIYSITKDAQLENILLDKALAFWHAHVLTKIPPPPVSEADCKLLYLQSKESKSIEVTAEVLGILQEVPKLNAAVSECEDRLSQIKQALMQAMQDADTLSWNGKVLATWKAPKPSFKLDAKTITQDHPELAAQYQMPITNSRRLVIKEGLLQMGAIA
jgi:putative phage-type endonuclease